MNNHCGANRNEYRFITRDKLSGFAPHDIFSVPCTGDLVYIGDTGRSVEIRPSDHKCCLRSGLLPQLQNITIKKDTKYFVKTSVVVVWTICEMKQDFLPHLMKLITGRLGRMTAGIVVL